MRAYKEKTFLMCFKGKNNNNKQNFGKNKGLQAVFKSKINFDFSVGHHIPTAQRTRMTYSVGP